MIWIIFDNVHVWKVTHVWIVDYFPDSRRSSNSYRIWNSTAYFPDFTVRYGQKIYEWGCIKQILTDLFIWKMVEIYCLLGEIQHRPVNSRPRLNYISGTIIFHHSLMSSQYLYTIYCAFCDEWSYHIVCNKCPQGMKFSIMGGGIF